MFLVWLKFIVCAIIIFFAGRQVARYGDIIAEKTGLGRLWIGVVLIAFVTSLPEVFTGVGCVVFVDAPDLTIGDILGANFYNLFFLAVLDFLSREVPLFTIITSGQLLVAVLTLVPVVIVITGIFLSPYFSFSFDKISIFSILIFVFYTIAVKTIFNFEHNRRKALQNKNIQEVSRYKAFPLKKTVIYFVVSAVVIVAAGIWLAFIGNELAIGLQLGKNFIGTLLLGITTTLPELTVSISALLIGAKELAVANLLGSNLFNPTIIFFNDVLYRKSPIFTVLSKNHIFVSLLIIFMTIIVMSGIILKPRKKLFMNLSLPSIGLITVFIIGHYINFLLSR